MHPSLAAVLGAALLAAAAPSASGPAVAAAPSDDGVAISPIPADDLEQLLFEALSQDPPNLVVRQTRYYGTVTIDHQAHLARRLKCGTCHDPGPVTKIEFTPKVAHDRCIGCHQTMAKGPAKCAGCHVRTEPPATVVANAPPPPPPGPNPTHVAAALAALDAPRPGAAPPDPFHRTLEVGLVVGTGPGFALRLASHQDWKVFTQSVDRISARDEAQTIGMLGAGVTRQVGKEIALEAVALGGFDVFDRPLVALLPALGARAGVEWRPQGKIVSNVSASLTGVLDLGSHAAGGMEVGGTTIYATFTTGFGLPTRRSR